MHPILFQVGRFTVYTYTVLLDLGLLAGLGLFWWLSRRQFDLDTVLDATLCAVAGGVVGGRVAYVIANWVYFRERVAEAFFVWKGGLSFHGAFLAGLAAFAAYALYRRLPLLRLADLAAPALALGQVFGWLGCLMAGSAYGLIGDGLVHLFLPDIYGLEARRFPTQIAGAVAALAILAILLGLRQRIPVAGSIFALYLLLSSAAHFLLELTRGDETIYWGAWRAAQWVDLALILAAAALLAYLWRKPRSEVPQPAADGEGVG